MPKININEVVIKAVVPAGTTVFLCYNSFMDNRSYHSKTRIRNDVLRLILVLVFVLVQLSYIFISFLHFSTGSIYIMLSLHILSIIFAIYIYNTKINSSMRLSWMLLVLAFPLFGVLLYFFSNHDIAIFRAKKRYNIVGKMIADKLSDIEFENKATNIQDESIKTISSYLESYGGFVPYKDTKVLFFDNAMSAYEAMLDDIKQAKEFIFIEYFCVEEHPFFNELVDTLTEKVKSGVKVRVFYDDVGSIKFVSRSLRKMLVSRGMEVRVFNQVNFLFNLFMQNRDHRKLTIIDGRVGYTGGYNLAREYFGITKPYGHWKDTGVRLEGEAVNSMTAIFLENWIASYDKNHMSKDMLDFFRTSDSTNTYSYFVQPYSDSPLDYEHMGENIFLAILGRASHYAYFTTPYFVVTDELIRQLRLAAKRGVDVRIVLPGIPDKKIVYQISRSYYSRLVEVGVKIYEYTPGFIHAKQCISDDDILNIGTINMDYRSFYHHFEDGCLIFGKDCEAIEAVKADFEHIFAESRLISAEDIKNKPLSVRFLQSILRLVAPLM